MLRVNKKIISLLLVTVFMLIVIGVSSSENSAVNWLNNTITVSLAPVQGLISAATGRIGDALYIFKDIKAIREENERLKTRVDELESKNRELEFYGKQNEELSGILALKNRYKNYTPIMGNVIARDAGNWFNMFTIDLGMNDGLDNDNNGIFDAYYPVVTSKGLVGRLFHISAFSSKVITIIDEDSIVSAIMTKSRQYVEVRGDLSLRDKGLCLVDNIDPNADIGPGDTVETSGVGHGYPKGIIIGKIIEVKRTENNLKTYAILEPAVDFKTLETVTVLKSNTDGDGTESTGQ